MFQFIEKDFLAMLCLIVSRLQNEVHLLITHVHLETFPHSGYNKINPTYGAWCSMTALTNALIWALFKSSPKFNLILCFSFAMIVNKEERMTF
jgi:hypothetical protein